MTEYWKSQARKYCEFCKCWFADNKVSISFHENGKRHKENVQKHISQLSKKSAKDFKHKEKIQDEIKKMEKAAMTAYLKDVQNNADLTSQSINEIIGQSSSNPQISLNVSIKSPKPKSHFMWHEAKGDDGSSYYWNIQTNETTWDAPDEFYSIAQQEKEKLQIKESEKRKKKEEKQKHKESLKEAKAFLKRDKMKALSVAKDNPTEVKCNMYGPEIRAANPLGSWKPVIKEPEKKIDLQLPKALKEVLPPPVVMEPEMVVQFKEKRVESLGDGPVEFKKRKFNNPKRNMRQKVDDE